MQFRFMRHSLHVAIFTAALSPMAVQAQERNWELAKAARKLRVNLQASAYYNVERPDNPPVGHCVSKCS
ncbi:hypothetical protein FOC84_10530 [Achromobacter pestifer]|uniref:Uncharacterized protein n=1 Tax=Achromobacter pestifer TaxID=1353889 RepID=A0A7D4HQC3_9BURK|nr:hypothetical protein [Achromobacter pestifer]QKH35357.1 hypothetical protein FOC84_10530 [Achromobacter pestifer]